MQESRQSVAMDFSMGFVPSDHEDVNAVVSWEGRASLSAVDNRSPTSGIAAPLPPQFFFNGLHHHYHPMVANVIQPHLIIDTGSNTSSSTVIHLEDDALNESDLEASGHEERSPMSTRNSMSKFSIDETASPTDRQEYDAAEGKAQ
jgi:hypothetical protein